MAKPKESEDKKSSKKENSEEKKGSVKAIVIYILVSSMLIGGAMSLLFFDVFGLRTNMFMPSLGKISFLRSMMPDLFPSSDVEEDPYLAIPPEDRVDKIKDLEQIIEEQRTSIEELNTTIENNNTEIARLRVFEEQQLVFKNDKEAFDTLIAQKDPNAFVQFYKQISPENAEKLYSEAIVSIDNNEEIKDYIDRFNGMKPAEVAAIFEQMIESDMSLVVRIMNNIDSAQSANILAKMSAENAASVVKQLAPDDF